MSDRAAVVLAFALLLAAFVTRADLAHVAHVVATEVSEVVSLLADGQ